MYVRHCFTLMLSAVLLSATTAFCQPAAKSPALVTAETYLKKVLAANGANSPVPVPTAAERAAFTSLKATINNEEHLEIENWPPTPLNTLKTVGQLNGLVGQLSNTGIYKTKAEQNARDALRKQQMAAVKTRTESLKETGGLAKEVRLTTTPDQQLVMRRLGLSLTETNEIVSGGKTFDLALATPEELVDISEPGKKKFGSAYAKGAEDVEKKLANPKTGFVERSQLEEAKQARNAMITSAAKLLDELRLQQAAIEKGAAAPKKK